jgi:hypothetical protein
LLTYPHTHFDMATEAKTVRSQDATSKPLRLPAQINQQSRPIQHVQIHQTEPLANGVLDLVLLHNCSDGAWTAKLADRLRGVRSGDRYLQLSLVDWSSTAAPDTMDAIRKCLCDRGHLAIVISRAMALRDLPAASRGIELLKEISPAEGQVVTILKDNVTIPPVFREGEWFDFRDENQFEENISDVKFFLTANSVPTGQVYSSGPSALKERVLCNLFPVVELPKFIYSAETRFETESELAEACGGPEPLPFILKGSRFYTTLPLSRNSVFAPSISPANDPRMDNFIQWSSQGDRGGWAIELLNSLFRQHAWKRGLRWDKSTDQFYFPRNKPKNVWWEIAGRTVSREVTAPHMGLIELENSATAEVQYGWKHHSFRASFVQVQGNFSFRLEPSWLLTELDSKAVATIRPVGPIFRGAQSQERNGQVLRSLRFWSAVLAKGHHEIRMNTGQAPVRTQLTPLSGLAQFGIPGDCMNYDLMMLSEMEDDLLMPAVGALHQESPVDDEERVSSPAFGNFRNDHSQART